MKKFLFYSHDSYGLGNIRRMVAIANYLVARHQDIYILLITGSPMLHAFRTHPQIDYVKLPCLFRSKDGRYSAKLRCFQSEPLLSLRNVLIKNVVSAFKPDLFLIDKKPAGLGGELRGAISTLADLIPKPKMVLLLRDILDSPVVTREIWRNNQYFSLIEEHYDEVVVVGEQSVFDLPLEYSFPASVQQKTSFCGYLNRTGGALSRTEMRSKLASSAQKLVLVAAGGGDDGKQVLATYLNGIRTAPWREQVNTVLFYGPEMRETDYTELKALASGLSQVCLSEFSDDFMSYLAAADLVIAMGGYNTVCEILSLNKPAILIPRVTPVAEQLIRAECLSRLEILEYIHPDHLNAGKLMEKVHAQLFAAASLPYKNEVDLTGMERLENRLLS